MKIKVFDTTWKGGLRNFRLEVNGSTVVDISNKDMGPISLECTFCQCLRIPKLLRDVYHQGQKDGMGESVEMKTTKTEYKFEG